MMVQLPYDLRTLGISAHDFQHPSTMHGMGHTLRVSIFAAIIGRLTGHQQEGQKASVAALFHDIARINDEEDPSHGKRAAELVETKYKNYILSLGFSQEDILAMQYAIKSHCNCKELPSHHPYSIISWILKDADDLDRTRGFFDNRIRIANTASMIQIQRFYYDLIDYLEQSLTNEENIHLICETIRTWIHSKDKYQYLISSLNHYSLHTVQSVTSIIETPMFYHNLLNA